MLLGRDLGSCICQNARVGRIGVFLNRLRLLRLQREQLQVLVPRHSLLRLVRLLADLQLFTCVGTAAVHVRLNLISDLNCLL